MPQNILLITCDQYRYPRFYPTGGLAPALEKVLGFLELDEGNEYIKFFPGLMRLRKNAVLLANHTIAASACTPSRATIYTGQYGTRTGVTQTDGLFKSGDSPQYPWLKADGIPTLGSWMRAAGYTTHYFGKWHVSNPPGHSLQAFGFDNWEESYPEPHGSQANNLGLFRDVGFTDAACSFLRRRGLALNYNRIVNDATIADPNAKPPAPKDLPWFAVLSLTNPHDIATYPGVISQALPGTFGNNLTQSPFGPVDMPTPGSASLPPTGGTMTVPLNRTNFPTNAATLPPNFTEDLSNKPSCQKDYAYKFGLALASKLGFNITTGLDAAGNPLPLDVAAGVASTLASSIPFQLWSDPVASINTFIQLYAWLHSVVDPHIDRVLQALEDSGQAEDTIVMFLCDHGEYAGAHGGMMEKWHTAYQEALHVPVIVRFPQPLHPQERPGLPTPRPVAALTSHIDILPTILGLAGIDEQATWETLSAHRPVPQPVGVDLSPLIRGETRRVVERDQTERKGVLFITDDEITAPLSYNPDPHTERSYEEYGLYDTVVDTVRHQNPTLGLAEGATIQPNHIRCVRTQRYKLARYIDPSRQAKEEWEMYDLENDRLEETNLVQVTVSPPTAISTPPSWTNVATINAAARELLQLLDELEARCLPVVTEVVSAT